jgi:hypothetical protein
MYQRELALTGIPVSLLSQHSRSTKTVSNTRSERSTKTVLNTRSERSTKTVLNTHSAIILHYLEVYKIKIDI